MTQSQAKPARDGKKRAHALALFSMVIVATSFPVGDEIADAIDPAVLMLLRFTLAALLFLPAMAWRAGLHWPGWRALGGYVAISATLVAFFWCMFEGLRYTDALNTGALTTTIPGFTALFGALIVGERLGWHRLVALGLGMVGAVWVIFRGDPERLLALDLSKGDLIYFAGCVAIGFYGPLVKRFHRGEPVQVMTFWVLASCAVLFLLIGNVKLWTTDWAGVPLGVFGGIAWLAIGPTIITFFLIQSTTLTLGATRVQAYTYFVPALVVLLDWAVGRGFPTLMTLPGIGIVLIASVVIQRGAIREDARQS